MNMTDGSVKNIHATAVNALVGKKLLELDTESHMFFPTLAGFMIGHDRLRKSEVKPKNITKEVDSSNYVG
jgi:hypothetical protein